MKKIKALLTDRLLAVVIILISFSLISQATLRRNYDFGTAGTVANLGDLDDVSTSGAAKDKVLKYNGSSWVIADYDESFVFEITAFSDAISTTTQEIGTGTWKAIGAVSLTATYSNGDWTTTAKNGTWTEEA